MDWLTRRKFLHDLGLASAGLAATAALGCRPKNYPSSDFYVLLQGPWLLSAANSKYLLAMTSRQPCYRYDYIDPFPGLRPATKTAAPVFEARPGISLGAARSMRLDLCQGDNGSRSEQQRRQLFDGMRDQHQGLFYTSAVNVPDPCESAENRIEIELSYPQEVFAMGLEEWVCFQHLTYVYGRKIQQWPTTIVLRYTKWQTAAFSRDGSHEDILMRGEGQIHRKFTISGPLNNETPDQHAAALWNAVMKLAAFPHNEAPVPQLAACIRGKRAEPQTGGDGTIASEELKCLPCVEDGTTLVLSAAGSAGVHGVA